MLSPFAYGAYCSYFVPGTIFISNIVYFLFPSPPNEEWKQSQKITEPQTNYSWAQQNSEIFIMQKMRLNID